VKHPRIGGLKSGMNRISLKARILEIPKPESVITRFGGFATATNASIADETGIIQLTLWNKQIAAFSVGDLIQVENAHVVTFIGERQLRSVEGRLSVIEKGDLIFQGCPLKRSKSSRTINHDRQTAYLYAFIIR
jgi:ssDNA-binding replication factor A large subunit